MDATRRRFGSLVEWLVAAVCAVGAAVFASITFQEFRSVRAIVPVSAEQAPEPSTAAGVPPGVVRVPLLLLGNGRQVSVGQPLTAVAEHLGAAAQLVSEALEEPAAGRRITRVYSELGVRFILVFDTIGRDASPRVSAIFVQ